MIGTGSIDQRHTILSIYFNLFNQLLHQEPKDKQPEEPKKKDRSISKAQRLKMEREAKKNKKGEVDEEDNKVIELVLKGINTVLLKSSSQLDSQLKQLLENQTNLLFKLTHHKVFKIQLQTLKLLFQFAKSSKKLNSLKIEEEQQEKEAGEEGPKGGSFADRFYRTLYETLLRVH